MDEIIQAETADDIRDARAIFREYEQWLGLSLCFQSFEEELADLPGKYAPPDGRLYLARAEGETIGCIALRKIDDSVCEMKRLYLREAARGKGLGRRLVKDVIDFARSRGYRRMRLDTYPPKMGTAVTMYRDLGFREIEPYYENPHNDVLFLELEL